MLKFIDMKTQIKILFIPIMILCMALSCNKEEKQDFILKQNVMGIVRYFGNPAVDGCGWLIEIDSTIYSPLVLDTNFKKDSLKVILDYNILKTTWHCGWREPGYTNIEIKNISKQ